MVAVIATTDSLKDPAVGRTFLWVEDSPDLMVSESYREEQTRSDIIRVRQNVAEKLIDENFAHLLQVDTP